MANSRWTLRFARFLRVKPICNAVFKIRFLYFTRIKKSLRFYDDDLEVDGKEHNLRGLRNARPSERILWLIQPLAAIDKMTPDSTVLAIGVRYETDLLYLAAYGFHPRNIRGLDMMSYSPWVDLGNMHKMTYPDSSWDAVLLGWVLTYSNNPQLAADELVRVVKDGGLIAIGLTCYPKDVLDEHIAKTGSLMGTTGQIQTVDDVLALFENKVDRVYFRHDVADPAKQGPTMVIFSVKKNEKPAALPGD